MSAETRLGSGLSLRGLPNRPRVSFISLERYGRAFGISAFNRTRFPSGPDSKSSRRLSMKRRWSVLLLVCLGIAGSFGTPAVMGLSGSGTTFQVEEATIDGIQAAIRAG
jgi:hypothetical protein